MAGVKGQRSGGHNRKSEAQHRLDGTYEERRHGGRSHPKPEVGTPDPPAALTGDARREWSRLVSLLAGSEMLTVVDGAMLYQYCELHGDAQSAKKDLAGMRRRLASRRTDRTERLELQKQVARVNGQLLRYRQQIRMYLAEFGLSPKSRGGVDISPAGAGLGDRAVKDEMAEFDTPPALTLVHGGHG